MSDPRPVWNYHDAFDGLVEACDVFAANPDEALADVEARRAKNVGGDPDRARDAMKALLLALGAVRYLADVVLDETAP